MPVPDERERGSGDQLPSLISQVIAQVWDPVEAKVVLSIGMLGGENEPVSQREILGFPDLIRGVRGDGSDREPAERIRDALMSAVGRGILIALRDEDDGIWYMAATPAAWRIARSGQFQQHDGGDSDPRPLRIERPDVFGLYEQNIGVVTPIMADRLTEALETYPEEWIREAIGEAVTYNRRNWRYIQRILENWTTEGKHNETYRRDHEEHLDSEKYLRGKYAALFRKR